MGSPRLTARRDQKEASSMQRHPSPGKIFGAMFMAMTLEGVA